MANDEDIARIGFVIDNFDTLEYARKKDGSIDYDKEHQNSDGSYPPKIKMSKKINGTFYVVESVPVSETKSVFVKSAYISKKGSDSSTDEMLSMPTEADPQLLTSETLNRANTTTTTDNIPQTGGIVNVSEVLEENNYSFEHLTSKSDMAITKLEDINVYDENGKIDRKKVIDEGIKNVRGKNNPQNTNDNSYIHVKDVDRDVLVGKRGLSHGLSRNAEATAKVTTKIGDILENAIVANELKPRKNTSGGYILLGIAMDEKNYYPVRVVVNNYSVDEVEVLDVLYAVNAKKNQSASAAELPAGAVPPIKGSSTISIANLLNLVKNDFSDILSNDVLQNLGTTRKVSTLTESIIHKDTDSNDNKSQTGGIVGSDGIEVSADIIRTISENSADIFGIGDSFDIESAEVLLSGDKKLLNGLKRIAKGLGINIKVFDGSALNIDGIDGFYIPSERTVYINAGNPAKPLEAVIRHEVIHVFKKLNPSDYALFENFVIESYKAKYKEDGYRAWIEGKRRELEQVSGQPVEDAVLREELCADIGMDMMNNESEVNAFIARNKSAAQKLLDIINKMVSFIKRCFGIEENVTATDALKELSRLKSTVSTTNGRVERSHTPYANDNLPRALSIADLYKAQELLLGGIEKVTNVQKAVWAESGKAIRDDASLSYEQKWEKFNRLVAERMGTAKEQKNTTGGDDFRTSASGENITLNDIRAIQSIGKKSVNGFDSSDIKKTEAFARRYFKEMGTKSPFFRAWFGDWRAKDTSLHIPTEIPYGEAVNSSKRNVNNADTNWNITVDDTVVRDSLSHADKDKPYISRLLSQIDTVLERSILLDSAVSEPTSRNKKGSTAFMHYFYSVVEYNGNPFLAKIAVEEYNIDSEKRAYNVERIKMSALSRTQYSTMKASYRGNLASNADGISVADLFELVKTYDKKIQPKPVNEAFLNEDGTPKVFYHGTDNFGFTAFDGDMMFFTDNENVAISYSKDGVGVKSVNTDEFVDVDKMNINELVERLNAEVFSDGKKRLVVETQKYDTTFHKKGEQVAIFYNSFGANQGVYSLEDLRGWVRQIGTNGGVYASYLSMQNPLIIEDIGGYNGDLKLDDDLTAAVKKYVYGFESIKRKVTTNDVAEYAKNSGYDGVIFKGIYDNGLHNVGLDETSNVYVVFNSTQVKSATDNIGTFDGSNPDIRYSFKGQSDTNGTLTDSKSLQNDTERGTIKHKERKISLSTKKKLWHTDLSKKEYDKLMNEIKKDIETSTNNITDTANWYYTRLNGVGVFAIYSTEDANSPTLLYESKGEQAVLERKILYGLLEVIENGESIDGKSRIISRVSVSSWLQQNSRIENDNIGPLGRESSNRDVRVLQGQSEGEPTAAFRSVVENLLEVQDRGRDGVNDNSEIRFSASKPIEVKRDLIAMHNLTEDKLNSALSLGGLAMPSIAITKAERGHSGFGDISLILGRESIDPRVDRANEVYSDDAWTPTYPSIEYEADENVLNSIKEKIESLIPSAIQEQLGFRIFFNKHVIENEFNIRHGDISGAYKNSLAMKYAFLSDTGKNVTLPMKDGKVDYKAARDAINSSVNESEYKSWLGKLFESVIAKEGIRNDKDALTELGNRRSFDSLHYAHTLENAVKAMKQAPKQRGGLFGNSLEKSAIGKYKSIDEVKSNSERLNAISDEEYSSIKKANDEKLRSIAKRFVKDEADVMRAAELLCDGLMYSKTKEEFKDYIRREGNGWTIYSEEIADEFLSLANKVKNMPTRYFEAKPRRAVRFDEVKLAVIPDSVDKGTVSRLKESGVGEVITYESGNENARLEAINLSPEVLFSFAGRKKTDVGLKNTNTDGIIDTNNQFIENGSEYDARQETENLHTRNVGKIRSYESPGRNIEKTRLRIERSILDRSGRNEYVKGLIRGTLDTSIKEFNGIRIELINEEAYNDDIKMLADDLKNIGFENVGVFVGQGELTDFDGTFYGIVISDNGDNMNSIYIRYDTIGCTPRTVAAHEVMHKLYDTDIGKVIRKAILSNISATERNRLLLAPRYMWFKENVGTTDEVIEELICDIMSGANPMYARFSELSKAFWNNDIEAIQNFKINSTTNNALPFSFSDEYVKSTLDSSRTDSVLFSTNGTIPKGENPARDIDVPEYDRHGGKVSRGIRTVLEAGATPDSYVSPLLEDMNEGKYSHEVITDKAAREAAFRRISSEEVTEDGKTERVIDSMKFSRVLGDTLDRFENGDLSGKGDIALLHALYANFANSYEYLNEVDEKGVPIAEKLVIAMVQTASKAGQELQASRLLKKTTPAGKLYDLEMFVKNMNREIRNQWGDWVSKQNAAIEEQWGKTREDGKRDYKVDKESKKRRKDSQKRGRIFSKKQKDIILNEDLVRRLLEAKNPDRANAIEEKLIKDIAGQIRATLGDNLRSLRYTAMLTNPRTHVRNVIGNAIFAGVVKTRNLIDASLQAILIRDKAQRTKAIALTPKQRKNQNALLEYADKVFSEQLQFVRGDSGRYDTINDKIEENRKIFGFAPLEWIRKMNSNALEAEDIIFLRHHFKSHFANAFLAKGYTVSDIESGKIDSKVMERVMQYSALQAQKATFRDASALANALNRFQNTNATTDIIVGGIIPFKKTPINILKRGIEYSPLSIFKAGYRTISENISVKKGTLDNIDVAGILENLSEGLTGSAIFALGVWLLNTGILAIRPGDDEKEEKLGEAMGHQSYALELFGYSFTIDWAAPAIMPLFMGAECAKSLSDGKGINPMEVLSRISDPVIETSMLSGVFDVLNSIRYSESGSDVMLDLTTEVMSGYIMQYVPSIFGATARVFDDIESRTSRPSKSGDEGFWEMLGRKLANKLPIVRTIIKSKPYIDIMGKYDKKETHMDYFMSTMQNFLLPGYISKISNSVATKELSNIAFESNRSDMIPGYVSKIKDHKLTHDEYFEYHVKRGELYDDVIPYLTEQDWYMECTADQKAEILSDFKEAADKLVEKSFMSEDYNMNSKALTEIYDYWYSDGGWIEEDGYSLAEEVVDFYLYDKYKKLMDGE